MGLFDSKLLELLAKIIHDQNKELIRCCNKKCPPNPVHLVLTISYQKSKFIIMSLQIAANQFAVGALQLIDSVTQAPVTATFTGTTAVSDNDAVATASVNGDGTVTVTGVSAGTCNVTVSTVADFTNSLGAASTGSVSYIVPVTVDAVAVADGVELVVTFGAPQPKP